MSHLRSPEILNPKGAHESEACDRDCSQTIGGGGVGIGGQHQAPGQATPGHYVDLPTEHETQHQHELPAPFYLLPSPQLQAVVC